MRLYSFQNFYLAGIHAGIQTAHTIARMSQKYSYDDAVLEVVSETTQNAVALFHDWARRGGGETIIVKNGGMQCNLEDTLALFESEYHDYPFDYFHEANEALGGAMTNVSIVVPERIWKFADALRRFQYDDYLVVNTNGTLHYLVDSETYAPIRSDLDDENTLRHTAFEKNELPVVDGIFVAPTYFDRKLIEQMNRCGLMS